MFVFKLTHVPLFYISGSILSNKEVFYRRAMMLPPGIALTDLLRVFWASQVYHLWPNRCFVISKKQLERLD